MTFICCGSTETTLWTVSVEPQQMKVMGKVWVTPGGGLTRYIASVPAGQPRMLKYLPADSWMALATKVGDFEPLGQWSSELFKKMVGESTESQGMMKLFSEKMTELFPLYGNEIAVAVTSKPGEPMKMTEAVEVKDPRAFAEAMADFQDTMKGWADLWQQYGMKMETSLNPSVEIYKGHQIAQWKMKFDFSVPAAAEGEQAEQMKQVVETQKKMLEALYGPTMLMHYTFVDNDWLMSMGPDSLNELKKLLDGSVQPISGSQNFAAALAKLPQQRTGVGYLSLGGFANWYVGIVRVAMESTRAPWAVVLDQIKFGQGPGVAMVSNWSGRTVEYNVVVSAQELAVLFQGFQQAMMQVMMQQQQQQAPQGAPAVP